MVDSLTEWIRNLVSLVLSITFFEMLLPRGSIAKYARFVFGLLIIVSLLDPLLSLRNYLTSSMVVQGLSWELADISSRKTEQQIIEQGGKLAVKSYTKKLADYIRDILIVTEGISDASVYVLSEHAGDIKKIDVVVSLANGDDTVGKNEVDSKKQINIQLPGVKEIEVSISDGVDIIGTDSNSDRRYQIVEKIKEIVANICAVSTDKIGVSII